MAEERTPESDRESGLPHPRETLALVGHADAERVLSEAWSSKRLAHAWLIGGPKGIGKATLAYRFARAVLAGRPLDSRGVQPLAMAASEPVFRQVSTETHPDVLVLRRPWDEKAKRFKTELPIDDLRRIYPFFGRRAGAGGWRVCIVDCADDLSASAANALLKMLEEPPPNALLLIIAHAPGRLLPTIRSRCRKLMLTPLPQPALVSFLAEKLPDFAAAERALIAGLADGCIGRALALSNENAVSLLREMNALVTSLPAVDPARMHTLGDRLARPAEEQAYDQAVAFLLKFLQRRVRDAVGKQAAVQIEPWLALWDQVRTQLAKTEAVALDKKQTLMSIIYAMAHASSVKA